MSRLWNRVRGDPGLSEPPAPGPSGANRSLTGRLDMLRSVGDDVGGREALRLGLEQAVSALRGLGGMVHLGGGEGGDLYLAARSGLPEPLTQGWEHLKAEDPVAPALALRNNTFVWSPSLIPKDGFRPRAFPVGTGLAAVPLAGRGGAQGALSVLTATTTRPGPEEEAVLSAIARWIFDRLHQPVRASGGPPGWAWPSRSHLQRTRRGAGVGAWEWDLSTGEMNWDETALSVIGADPDELAGGAEAWRRLVHPDDLPRVLAITEEATRAGKPYSVEYRVRQPDGRYRWAEARGHLVPGEDGTPSRVIGTVVDTTDSHILLSAEQVPGRMSDGFLALDDTCRITYLNQEAELLLAPSAPALGKPPWQAVPAFRTLGLEAACRQAVADGMPIGFDAQWPGTPRVYHIRLVPVPEGLTVHIMDVTDEAGTEGAVAHRAARLEELAGALAAAATVQEVIGVFADRALPLFGAAGMLIQLSEGTRLETVGSRGYSEEFLRLLVAPGHPQENPLQQALRSAVPTFVSSPEEFVQRYPELAHLPESSGKAAWAFLPLIVSGDPIGYCALSFDRPRVLTGEERTLLTALSGLVAQALARAHLYDAEHSQAQELQRGLLPRSLPSLPAVTASARYLPASGTSEVGGDWYDLIPLSGDRVALVVGDVMGHGLSEAADMGRLRMAVHTLADLELPPGELLFHLNDIVTELGDDFYATCLYVEYDPAARTCAIARAGHSPPAVVHPDGTVHFPELPVAPPLGAATPPFDTCEIAVPEDGLLVLYTDGLVETGGRDIQGGMMELARVLTTAFRPAPPGAPAAGTASGAGRQEDAERLESLCDTVMSALLPPGQRMDDDAALLVARLHPLAADDIASWPLPDDPRAAGQARGYVRDQLRTWHLDDLTTTTELLVSELVGNVIRHAEGPIGLRLLHSRTLICEVYDGSPATPRIRRAGVMDEGGRGLQLVAALAGRWGARYTREGKCIWTEQPVPTGA